MAAATLKLFLQQNLATQYADLQAAGALVKEKNENYYVENETYTFLTATFHVSKRLGVVQAIYIDTAKIPALA